MGQRGVTAMKRKDVKFMIDAAMRSGSTDRQKLDAVADVLWVAGLAEIPHTLPPGYGRYPGVAAIPRFARVTSEGLKRMGYSPAGTILWGPDRRRVTVYLSERGWALLDEMAGASLSDRLRALLDRCEAARVFDEDA